MKKAAEYAIEGEEKEFRIVEDSKAPSFSDYDNSDSELSYCGQKHLATCKRSILRSFMNAI